MDIKSHIERRKILHMYPDLSGNEKKTVEIIKKMLIPTNPEEIIENLGGNGIAFIYQFKKKGKRILIRAELDALPIQEINQFNYRSTRDNISHKCGHDGHMTILVGLAHNIKTIGRKIAGTLILLFQPAEETAQGAKAVMADPRFNRIKADYYYALHNLPGFPIGSLIIKPDIFCSASKGIIITLKGKTSHAAHPENSNSPVLAVSKLIEELIAIPSYYIPFSESALITIIHINIGKRAFGTTPGDGQVMATLRSHRSEDLNTMSNKVGELVDQLSKYYKLSYNIEWVEAFPPTINDAESVEMIKKNADDLKINIISPKSPFPWSEDFGFFLNGKNGAFFGLGAGENHPQLHNPDYDFPDQIIQTGINLFSAIITSHLGES